MDFRIGKPEYWDSHSLYIQWNGCIDNTVTVFFEGKNSGGCGSSEPKAGALHANMHDKGIATISFLNGIRISATLTEA